MGRREIAAKIREHDDQGCDSCGSTCHRYADLLDAALVALEAPEPERVVLGEVDTDSIKDALHTLDLALNRLLLGRYRIIAERVEEEK